MRVSETFRTTVLCDGATERDAHAFLKQYPYVLAHLFNMSWNFWHIFPEFRLGSDFRADFLLLSADSGSWTARFIELEGPHDKPYKRDLRPLKKLNYAIRQTDDWREFEMAYRNTLLHEFSKLLRPLEIRSQNSLMGKGPKADVEIEHPRTHTHFDYHIIIGNSRSFSAGERKLHARYSNDRNVVTYDRVYSAICDLESRCKTLDEQLRFLSCSGSHVGQS